MQPIAVIILSGNVGRRSIEVLVQLNRSLTSVNNKLESHHKLDYLMVCQQNWTIADGLLATSMKIKRKVIEQKHHALVAQERATAVVFEEYC